MFTLVSSPGMGPTPGYVPNTPRSKVTVGLVSSCPPSVFQLDRGKPAGAKCGQVVPGLLNLEFRRPQRGILLECVTDRLIHCECFGCRCRFLRSCRQPHRSEHQSPLESSSVSLHLESIVHPVVYPNAVISRNRAVSLRQVSLRKLPASLQLLLRPREFTARSIALPKRMSSTSLELGRAPLKERPDALPIVGAIVNATPYSLNPLESFRVERIRFGEYSQLLLQ